MRYKVYLKIAIPILIIVFFIIYIQLKELANTGKEYPKIKFSKEYHGIVTKAQPYQSVCYTELDSSVNVMLGLAVNYEYKEFYLNRFIRVGDSISKGSFTDTIFIYRDSQEFMFLLGQYINE
jgi:hypothetical protein